MSEEMKEFIADPEIIPPPDVKSNSISEARHLDLAMGTANDDMQNSPILVIKCADRVISFFLPVLELHGQLSQLAAFANRCIDAVAVELILVNSHVTIVLVAVTLDDY